MARSLGDDDGLAVDFYYCVEHGPRRRTSSTSSARSRGAATTSASPSSRGTGRLPHRERLAEENADLAASDVLICGPPAMIENLRTQLADKRGLAGADPRGGVRLRQARPEEREPPRDAERQAPRPGARKQLALLGAVASPARCSRSPSCWGRTSLPRAGEPVTGPATRSRRLESAGAGTAGLPRRARRARSPRRSRRRVQKAARPSSRSRRKRRFDSTRRPSERRERSPT